MIAGTSARHGAVGTAVRRVRQRRAAVIHALLLGVVLGQPPLWSGGAALRAGHDGNAGGRETRVAQARLALQQPVLSGREPGQHESQARRGDLKRYATDMARL
ncbi:hypothetical protein M8R19_27625 [Pseudomonas sp. R3.Fl]|uniref:hypothetical protein n=1 Tax=Pseudomonas TaxID=286 RepID=UPI00201DB58D|nr:MULTISPECIES: hypothetical protein [Pseudomonas]MCL6692458.1 hypothetical protein [Pseudomonas sp. R3.Fl]MDN6876708.1 hypothetical protein [Pseudomonas citronellolis]